MYISNADNTVCVLEGSVKHQHILIIVNLLQIWGQTASVGESVD